MDDEFFNSLNVQSEKFSEFENLLNIFVEDLIDSVAALTQHHFYLDNQATGFFNTFKVDKINTSEI